MLMSDDFHFIFDKRAASRRFGDKQISAELRDEARWVRCIAASRMRARDFGHTLPPANAAIFRPPHYFGFVEMPMSAAAMSGY